MSEQPIKGCQHQLVGEEFSWAGECPWTSGLCFGTYSGRLFMPLGSGQEVALPASIAVDAINDVAFAGTLMAASTRGEVAVLRLNPSLGQIERLGEPYEGGAHGITARAAGGFLAPLGPDGLLFLDAVAGPGLPLRARVGNVGRDALNFYKLASLCAFGGRGEVFASATRRDGLLIIVLDRGEVRPPILGYHSPGLDIVDVCSLRSPRWPLAAAALGADRTILLSRNVFEDRPQPLRLDGLKGKAYSLLCTQGHLFLLTRDGLAILPHLASRFLAGDPLDRPLRTWIMEGRSAEAFMAYDEIFLESGGEMVSFPIDLLAGDSQRFESLLGNPVLPDLPWEPPMNYIMALEPVA